MVLALGLESNGSYTGVNTSGQTIGRTYPVLMYFEACDHYVRHNKIAAYEKIDKTQPNVIIGMDIVKLGKFKVETLDDGIHFEFSFNENEE